MNRQEAQKRIEAIEKEAAELKKMVMEQEQDPYPHYHLYPSGTLVRFDDADPDREAVYEIGNVSSAGPVKQRYCTALRITEDEAKRLIAEAKAKREPVVRCFETGVKGPGCPCLRKFVDGKCAETWLGNGKPASKNVTERGHIQAHYTEFPPEEWDDRVAELLEMNTNCPVCGSDVSLDFSFARCNNGGCDLHGPDSQSALEAIKAFRRLRYEEDDA